MSGGATAIASAWAKAVSSDGEAQAFTRAAAQAYTSGQPGFTQAYASALATTTKTDVKAAARIIEQSSEGEMLRHS